MTQKRPRSQYPWAELYDIESGVKRLQRSREAVGPGRPPNLVKRHKTSITLMDEEKRLYEKLAYVLGSRLHPNKVTKSQVMGLALRLLDSRLETLPETMESWERLANEIFMEEEVSKK
jgi:hypothetical protein